MKDWELRNAFTCCDFLLRWRTKTLNQEKPALHQTHLTAYQPRVTDDRALNYLKNDLNDQQQYFKTLYEDKNDSVTY